MSEKDALLIVDDEPDIRDLIKEILSTDIEEIYTAGTGVEALAVLKEHKNIRAILSDVMMPEMTGLELLRELRMNYNPIPFVIISAFGNAKTMREAIQFNATDFLDKPFNREELLDIANRVIRYGAELAKVEKSLDEAYGNTEDEDTILKKRLTRTTLAMKMENDIFKKK